MRLHKCDLCGKFFNAYDEEEKFGLHYSKDAAIRDREQTTIGECHCGRYVKIDD